MSPPPRVRIACPLRFERDRLQRWLPAPLTAECCGPGGRAASEWVRSLPADTKSAALVGVAGALDPRFSPGAVAVAGAVAIDAPNGRIEAPARARGLGVERLATVLSVDAPITTAGAKAALRDRTGADLVDLEAHAFAEAATARRLDWLVVRAVSDGADDELPAGIANWIDDRGRTRLWAVLLDLLRRPGDLALVRRLAGATDAKTFRSMGDLVGQWAGVPSAAHASGPIVVFGGSFDPPQLAHVRLPRQAARSLGASRLIYVPTSSNPLKSSPPAPPDHRLAMLRLALREAPEAQIATIELDAEGPSYTVETLRRLRDRVGPKATIRLLMGSDLATSFRRWREPEAVLALATPAVMLRPPHDRERFQQAMVEVVGPAEADRWMPWVLDTPLIDASATEVRDRLADGRSADDLLDPAVTAYIREHGLYGGRYGAGSHDSA